MHRSPPADPTSNDHPRPTPSREPVRLAIVSSHPIQYNAPLFRALASDPDLQVRVFYSWKGTSDQIDPEFGHAVTWDIPLLDGYDFEFVPNVARSPGTHHFAGLNNPEMTRRIARFEPDAILVYGWSSKTHLSVLRRFKGKVPILFRGDSTLATGRRFVHGLLRRIWLTWVYRHIDIALYVGKKSREYFLAYGVPDRRLKWAPHSVENNRFNSEDAAEAAALQRRELGIAEPDIVYLFAGKLVPRKAPLMLLKAFAALQKEAGPGANIHLVFAGSGPLEAELKSAAAGIENIHFVGFRNQSAMPATYRIGDVMVLPSSIETWGLAVNEAMASARPVILSDAVGCAPDFVTGNGYAVSFPSGDEQALKDVMARFAKSRSTCLQLGADAAAAIEQWSVEAAAQRIKTEVVQCRG